MKHGYYARRSVLSDDYRLLGAGRHIYAGRILGIQDWKGRQKAGRKDSDLRIGIGLWADNWAAF